MSVMYVSGMNSILILSALFSQQPSMGDSSRSPEGSVPNLPGAPVSVDSTKRVSPWKKEAQANLNLASAYFDQWAPGGEDNLSWTAKLATRWERDGADWNWLSKASAEFGQIKLGDRALRKTTDELKAETILSRKLSRYLNPFVAANLQTQFARGYKYPADTLPRLEVSDPLDPLYLTQSAGVGSKPVEWFQTRLGAALREVRTDYFTSYSDDPNTAEIEDWKVEPGLEWVTEYKQTIAGNLLLQSTLSTFTNFKGSEEIVMVWTNGATFQFTRFINLNASGELHRDLQQADAWQWKHVLALGLTYNLL